MMITQYEWQRQKDSVLKINDQSLKILYNAKSFKICSIGVIRRGKRALFWEIFEEIIAKIAQRRKTQMYKFKKHSKP